MAAVEERSCVREIEIGNRLRKKMVNVDRCCLRSVGLNENILSTYIETCLLKQRFYLTFKTSSFRRNKTEFTIRVYINNISIIKSILYFTLLACSTIKVVAEFTKRLNMRGYTRFSSITKMNVVINNNYSTPLYYVIF